MKNYSTFLIITSLLFLTWTAFTPSTNQTFEENWEEKISPNLMQKAIQGEALDFIVLLNNQQDVSNAKNLKTKDGRANFVFQKLKQNAKHYQKNIINILNQTQATYRPFYIINGLQIKGDFNLLKKIAQLPEVKSLTDNSPVLFEAPRDEPNLSQNQEAIEWGIDMIDADEVWAMGIKGEGVVVGGQDTGYEWTHPALSNQYRGNGATVDHNYNWHDAIHEINPLHGDSVLLASNNPCGLDSPFPCDDHDHGTHTMGTMIGEDGDNQIGVAPNAKWVACRSMERGYGMPSTYIECFEWFMAPTDLNNENPDPTKAPHVIANSWSCPTGEGCDSTNWDVMELVVQNLKASGVVVVVSAGNSGSQGCGSVSTPAAMFEASMSIGATSSSDVIAGFSSRGPVTVNGSGLAKPNVSAPGVAVRSSTRDSSYATWSGTSMAGPHAAGMVALMISANPQLAGQVEVIEDIMEQTAVPKTDTIDCGGVSSMNIPNNIYGFGRINALAAVNQAIDMIVATDDLIETAVDVFPNPTDGLVSFEITNMTGEVDFELYDLAGHQVQSQKWNLLEFENKTVDMSVLPSGVYIYKLKNETSESKGKIVKN